MPETNPSPKASSRQTTPAPTPDAYDFLGDETEDRGPLRGAIALALAVHLVLLAVNLPAMDSTAKEPAPERRVFVVETPRFRPPPPTPDRPPPQSKRAVPMPDPTPDEPEPIVVDIPEPTVEPVSDDLLFDMLPDAPPVEPEPPSGPLLVGRDVERPNRVHYVEPRYTEPARKARVQGSVIVRLTIDERGEVSEVVVLKGLPLGLTEQVERAVRQWRFEPATVDGKPVSVYYHLTVHMSLS